TRQATAVTLIAEGNMRWSTAIAALDAAAAAGLGEAGIVPILTPKQEAAWRSKATLRDLRALVAAEPVLDRVGCRIGPATVFAAVAPDAPPRVSGGYAGFFDLREVPPPPPPAGPSEVITEEVIIT